MNYDDSFTIPALPVIVGDKPDNVAKIQLGVTIFLVLVILGVILGILAHHHQL